MQSSTATYRDEFKTLGCCVIIPTYNNSKTLQSVIEGVLEYCGDVIVVDDGSEQATKEIIQSLSSRLTVITHPENQGKGRALRNAFKKAWEMGFTHAVTIDSDGQHFPEDLPAMLEARKANPQAMIMGSRNMDQADVPGKSSFGNKFSNFWFWVETGLKMPDTQTGYRLYPLEAVSKRKFFTNRFEFEIEVLVKLSWHGTPFESVPVKVLYDQEDRVSHFRPFKDFMRISYLNAYLVTLALLWYHPVYFFKNIRRIVYQEAVKPEESSFSKAAAIGFGIFMGILPVWGFQMLIAFALAVPLKLNKILVLVASNISIPIFLPFIIWASYEVGAPFMDQRAYFDMDSAFDPGELAANVKQYLIGSVILSVAAGITMFLLSWMLFRTFRKKP